MRARHLLALVPLLASACGTHVYEGKHWRRVPATAAGQASAGPKTQIEDGDTVKVVMQNNKVYLFRVYEVTEDGFLGTAKDKRDYRISYENVQSLYVRREGAYLATPIGTVSGH